MNDNKKNIQLYWGIALVLMGIAMLFRIPQVMPKLMEIEHFIRLIPFIKFCLYFMAAALIWGGGKKILQFRKNGDI